MQTLFRLTLLLLAFVSNYFLCASPAVHVIAHLLNVEWYNNSRLGVYDALSTALSDLADDPVLNTTYLNPIRNTDLVRDPTVSYDDDDKSGISNRPQSPVGLCSSRSSVSATVLEVDFLMLFITCSHLGHCSHR